MKYNTQTLSFAATCILLSASLSADTNVGAYVNGDGWNTETIDQFNADTVRHATSINHFTTFEASWDNISVAASNIVSRNAVPLITWMPYDSSSSDILSDIVSGQKDAYIDNWIDGFINWRSNYPSANQPSILLRFGHEFNGTWYPWGNQPEALKAAWRYIHQRFSDAGINDAVGWVWCANNVDVDDYSDITQYYPGDDYVDWLSIDGYNWGSNYSFTRWKSFDETFSQQYVKMVNLAPNKPIMLAEVGSTEPHDVPDSAWNQDGDDSDISESKEAWITDMMQSIQADYPAIKSIVWFNTNKELSWALNLAGNTGLSAYNDSVISDYFGAELTIKSNTEGTTETSEKRPKQKGKSATKNTSLYRIASSELTGIDKALTKVPQVVGQRLLEMEAQGLRDMPKEQLQAWRLNRIIDK